MITTFMETLTNHTLVLSVGWTLIHFLWQAALVGVVTAISLRIMRRSSAQAKYVAACAGLAVMAFLPIATFAYQIAVSDETGCRTADSSMAQARDLGIIAVKNENDLSQKSENARELVNLNSFGQLAWIEIDDAATAAPVGWFSRREAAASALRNWLPWCVLIWMTGVLLLAIRMLFGVHRVWRWKRESVAVIKGELVTAVERLSRRMNLRQRVRILETAREAVPAVVGWIRPAILVPASMLSGLTTDELESIMAHELAHIRRYDYPINLMQTVVETALFYHPAVWWISNRIREERENCCDDIAIEVCGNRMAFARALARIEEIRCRDERLAIAANGGSLLGRIRRILYTEPVPTGSWWLAGAMILGSLGLLLGGMWMTVASARAGEKAETEPIVKLKGNDLEPDLVKALNKVEKRKSETILADSKTKMEQRVFTGIKLSVDRQGELCESSLAMKYTNVMSYSFIPARVAKQLAATELGEIDFGTAAPVKKRPFQAIFKLNEDSLHKPVPVVEPNAQKQLAKPITYLHDLTSPVDGETTIAPYPDDAVWVPGHLTFYGLNQTQQHRFKIVRIDKVALGVGPEFGPVNALVLDDANSDFGLLGMDWIQQVRGENGEGLWFVAAEGALYFMAGTVGGGEQAAKSPPPEAKQESKADGAEQLKFQTVERDGDRVMRVVISALTHGRTATELVRHFALGIRDPSILQAGSTTNMESIVSASKPNYLLNDRMEAAEVLFNLPEGSGLRAEFSGKNVEINRDEKATTVIVTNGKIELIDAGGVIRAWASPDGGAEQLVIECREDLGEVVMAMKTHRIKESPEYPNPPVQVVMNTNTGAPKDEGDPPHGAIRYEILQDDKKPEKQVRMKMKWRYEMKRLMEEAKAESGLSADELIHGKQKQSPQKMKIPLPRIPQPARQVASQPDDSDDSSWGRLAENSGLRSRLTLMTKTPTVGKPILLKLEIKNFGKKPTNVDAQNYEPFRVLRVIQEDGKSAKFIGMTPQTDGEEQQLKPGESLTLWEKVDANGLFLVKAGRYKFMAKGGRWAAQTLWRDSNTVEVQIADGEQSPLNRLLEKLADGLPEKWEVASGMGLAEGWKGIFLTHTPTDLKSDATGIQIWFTDKKLADDFELGTGDQKQIVTQLGQGKLGFMNVAAQPKTLDIWPDYLEHIRKAANQSLNR